MTSLPLEAISESGLAVFVHPWDAIGEDKLRAYYLPHMVCLPADTAIAASRLIFGGVLDRLPALRVGFAHGGGNFLPLLSRIDHGHKVRSEAKVAISEPPSSYLHRLYFDSITHDAGILKLICDRAGSRRVMMGSDYPFDMGVENPVTWLREIGLPEPDLGNILYRTAEEFLALTAEGDQKDAA